MAVSSNTAAIAEVADKALVEVLPSGSATNRRVDPLMNVMNTDGANPAPESPAMESSCCGSTSSFPTSTTTRRKARPASLFGSFAQPVGSASPHSTNSATNPALPHHSPAVPYTPNVCSEDALARGAISQPKTTTADRSPGLNSSIFSPPMRHFHSHPSMGHSHVSHHVALSADMKTLYVGEYRVTREGCLTLRNHLLVNPRGVQPDPSATPPLRSTLREEPLSPISYSMDALPFLPPATTPNEASTRINKTESPQAPLIVSRKPAATMTRSPAAVSLEPPGGSNVTNSSLTSSNGGVDNENPLISQVPFAPRTTVSAVAATLSPDLASCSATTIPRELSSPLSNSARRGSNHMVPVCINPSNDAISSNNTNGNNLVAQQQGSGVLFSSPSQPLSRNASFVSGSMTSYPQGSQLRYSDLDIDEVPFEAGASASVHEAHLHNHRNKRFAVKRIQLAALFPMLEAAMDATSSGHATGGSGDNHNNSTTPSSGDPQHQIRHHHSHHLHHQEDSQRSLFFDEQRTMEPAGFSPVTKNCTPRHPPHSTVEGSIPTFFACNSLPKHRQLHSILYRELYMLHSEYRSAHVVKMYNAFFIPEKCALDIAMEFMDYGCLEKLGRFHSPTNPVAPSSTSSETEDGEDRSSSSSSGTVSEVGASFGPEAAKLHSTLPSGHHAPCGNEEESDVCDDEAFSPVGKTDTLPPNTDDIATPADGHPRQTTTPQPSQRQSQSPTTGRQPQVQPLLQLNALHAQMQESVPGLGAVHNAVASSQPTATAAAESVSSQQEQIPTVTTSALVESADSASSASGSPKELRMPLPERVLAIVAEQVLRGIHDMHARGHVHRDIKPQNILVNHHGVVKLSDFGLLEAVSGGSHPSHQGPQRIGIGGNANTDDDDPCSAAPLCSGTDKYMSPERHRGEAHGKPSDIWAFGVTLAECALGRYPVCLSGCQDEFERLDRMKKINFRHSIDETVGIRARQEALMCISPSLACADTASAASVSPGVDNGGNTLQGLSSSCVDFIQQCLAEDPAQRPTAMDLQHHPFLSQWPDVFDFAACIAKMRRSNRAFRRRRLHNHRHTTRRGRDGRMHRQRCEQTLSQDLEDGAVHNNKRYEKMSNNHPASVVGATYDEDGLDKLQKVAAEVIAAQCLREAASNPSH